MLQPLVPARLAITETGTPWPDDCGDVYHPAEGGPGQACHVFLQGNDLPARWRSRDRFTILETGFGAGLNFLATWTAWRDDPHRAGKLHFLSVEKHPFHGDDLAVLHARWPEFAEFSSQLRSRWPTLTPGFHRLEFESGQVFLTLLFGAPDDLLPQLQARIDAIYLDGFSSAKNPDLWSPGLIKQLGRRANPEATIATWSIAASVRKGLANAGFNTEIRPGYGHKREMLTGRFEPKAWQIPAQLPTQLADRRAIVIGAGLAGTACCERLASRGWQVTLIDRHPAPAMAASGNLAGIVMPLVSRDDNIASRISRAAYLHTLRHWRTSNVGADLVRDQESRNRGQGPLLQTDAFSACGVLQLARDGRHEDLQRALAEEMGYPLEFVSFLSRNTAEAMLGYALPHGGWFFSQGGWAHPPGICAANLARAGSLVTCRFGESVASLEECDDGWRALNGDAVVIAAAPLVILASGADADCISQASHLPLQKIRGQVSLVPEGGMPTIPFALCREGYATPALNGFHAAGASYDVDDNNPLPRIEDNAGNLARLDRLLPGTASGLDASALEARVGFRSVPPDRLPLVGALSNHAACLGRRATQLKDLPRHPGLYTALGYASRGLVWSSLMAELLVCEIEGEPLPIEKDLADAVDPGRFLLKELRRRHL